MQKYLSFPSFGDAGSGTQPDFKVVVAYEDFFTGEQAKATIDRLLQQFEWRHNITLTLWHFDVLKEPALRDIATRDAAQADMVVVAVDPDDELSAEVKGWFDQWTPWKQKGEGVLVALLNHPSPDYAQQSGARVFLERVAVRAGMNFICQTLQFSGQDFIGANDLFLDRFDQGASGVEAVLALDALGSKWGINE